MIILPDNWVAPNGISWTPASNFSGDYEDNILSASQCQQMENAGAIFLPAAGDRGYDEVGSVGGSGNYWSSSYDRDNEDWAYRGVHFQNGVITSPAGDGPHVGYSVRLVKD